MCFQIPLYADMCMSICKYSFLSNQNVILLCPLVCNLLLLQPMVSFHLAKTSSHLNQVHIHISPTDPIFFYICLNQYHYIWLLSIKSFNLT